MKTVNLNDAELTLLLICLNGAQQALDEQTNKTDTLEQMNIEVQKLYVKLYDIKDGEVVADDL